MIVEPSYVRCREGDKCDVLCLGESPGREESVEGRAFVGASGQLLRKCLDEFLPDKSIILDNSVPEWLEGRKPNADLLKRYREYREDRIHSCSPRVILALGEWALKSLKINRRPLSVCGSVKTYGSHVVLCSVHPAFCLHSGDFSSLRTVFSVLESLFNEEDRDRCIVLDRVEDVKKVLDRCRGKLTAVDLETNSLNHRGGLILSIQISFQKGIGYGIPLLHKDSPLLTRENRISRLFRDWWPAGPRVCHHAKFEMHWIRRAFKARDPEELYCTMIQAGILNENESKSLDHQVSAHLSRPPYWTHLPEDKCYGDVDLKVLLPYGIKDAISTYELYRIQRKSMTAKQRKLADDLLLPLTKTLCSMEDRGMALDLKALLKVRMIFRGKATLHARKVEKFFPGVNFGSPKQVRELLFERMGLRPIKSTNTGLPSTDKETIEELSKERVELQHLVKARNLKSFLSRELEPLLEKQIGGRIHTQYGLGNVVTGRLSSSDPNLQNIGRDAPHRKCFVSRFHGGKMVSLDYKQHELRIMASLAGERSLLKVFRNGDDPYEVVNQQIGVGSRSKAKMITLALIYGITSEGISSRTGLSLYEAEEFRRRWMDVYYRIPEYHDRIQSFLRRNGYVENASGRRRHLSDPDNPREVRQAYNFMDQSLAAEITYRAMIAIERRLSSRRGLLVHQTHDSILLDVPGEHVKYVSALASRIMESPKMAPISVPLAVEVKVEDHI